MVNRLPKPKDPGSMELSPDLQASSKPSDPSTVDTKQILHELSIPQYHHSQALRKLRPCRMFSIHLVTKPPAC